MTVHLSPHGQELLEEALARGVGRSPEEVVERALEAAGGMERTLSNEELARRRQAVASMVAFGKSTISLSVPASASRT